MKRKENQQQGGNLILNFLSNLSICFWSSFSHPHLLISNMNLIYNHLDIHHQVPSRSSAKAAAINKFSWQQTKDSDFFHFLNIKISSTEKIRARPRAAATAAAGRYDMWILLKMWVGSLNGRNNNFKLNAGT